MKELFYVCHPVLIGLEYHQLKGFWYEEKITVNLIFILNWILRNDTDYTCWPAWYFQVEQILR